MLKLYGKHMPGLWSLSD